MICPAFKGTKRLLFGAAVCRWPDTLGGRWPVVGDRLSGRVGWQHRNAVGCALMSSFIY